MKRISKVLIVLVLTLLFTGCGYNKGDMYITLTSNPSTGYTWESKFSEEGILDLVSSDYIEPDNTNGMVGVAGEETFRFKPLKEGEVTITLKYRRQWEEEDESAYRLNYVIKVDDKLHMKVVSKEGEYLTYQAPEPVFK